MTRFEQLMHDAALTATLPALNTARASAIDAATALAAADATTKDVATKNAAATDATTKANSVKTQTDVAIAAAAAAMTAAQATPSRIRAVRVAVPAMAVGAAQTVAVTWPTPFADTSYTVPTPGVVGNGLLSVQSISSFTKEGCTVTLKNAALVALLAGAVTLHVLAIHDPAA